MFRNFAGFVYKFFVGAEKSGVGVESEHFRNFGFFCSAQNHLMCSHDFFGTHKLHYRYFHVLFKLEVDKRFGVVEFFGKGLSRNRISYVLVYIVYN